MAEIQCAYTELVPIHKMQPHPKNPHVHSPEQIDRLAKLIDYQGVRHPIIISKRSGFIVAGHGRLAALKKINQPEVPVDYQDFETEAQEYAFIVSDNAIGKDEWAALDLESIKKDIEGLDFDHSMLGLKDFSIEGLDGVSSDLYSKKIEAPIYEIKGEKPKLSELVDEAKANELISRIESSNCNKEVKDFLIQAARRHLVFNYEKIAEFYAHQDKETQDLMEQSALVIIDLDKAIEGGFVSMTEDLAKMYEE